MTAPRGREVVRARRAVAGLFLLNAMAYANVVPRLPTIKTGLGLSNTALGTAVAAMPVGALVAGLTAGRLIARLGSARVAVASAIGMGLVLQGFAQAQGWAGLAATFAVLGALDSLMDVSMNAHALRVQRRFGRSIINNLHGLWSIGAVGGAAVGALSAAHGVSLRLHLALAGASIGVAAAVLRRSLLAGPDEAVATDPAAGDPVAIRPAAARRVLALLGLLVVLAATIEDAPQSWGAIFLRQELGASVALGGLVFIAFQTSMTVGRLLGDRAVDRFGPISVLRAGGALTAVAVGTALVVDEPAVVVAGFALAGLGTAPLFPVVFHAAGEVPGVSTGHGVATVAWLSRLGFLVAPPIVGTVGDAVSLRAGLVIVPVAGLLIAALAGAPTRRAHRDQATAQPYDRRS